MKVLLVFFLTLAVEKAFSTHFHTIRSKSGVARHLQAASGSAGSDRLRSIFSGGRNIVSDFRWKDRVGDKIIVPYEIETRYFNPAQLAQIDRAANDLSNKAKVFQLVKRTTQASYVRVVNINGSCSSAVGKQPTGKAQDLNLAPGCFVDGIIQHEFIHALGLFHEQVRGN